MESLANATRERLPRAMRPSRGAAGIAIDGCCRPSCPTTAVPGVLINEDHSFGQVFVGCFYDTLRNVFLAAKRRIPLRSQAQRRSSASCSCARRTRRRSRRGFSRRSAARCRSRTTRSTGARITRRSGLGFEAHGILLGAVVAVAPRARCVALHRSASGEGSSAILATATLQDLRSRMSLPAHATMRVRDLRARRHAGGGSEPSACSAAAWTVREARQRRRARARARARRDVAAHCRGDGRVAGSADDQRRSPLRSSQASCAEMRSPTTRKGQRPPNRAVLCEHRARSRTRRAPQRTQRCSSASASPADCRRVMRTRRLP